MEREKKDEWNRQNSKGFKLEKHTHYNWGKYNIIEQSLQVKKAALI